MYTVKTDNLLAEERRGIVNLNELQPTQDNVESAKTRVFSFINQCIEDIEKTVLSSGLTMRDIGVDVEKYSLASQSYTIELKLRI